MSDYSKITNFLSKDSLSLNDPAKYVKGSEIDAEYNAIAVAIATKADTASPTLVTPNIGAATGTSLALGGGTALTTTNRTGTGNLVLATAPTLTGLTVSGGNFVSRGISDTATAVALSLSGSGANSVTIANSATSPVLGTSAGSLLISPGAAPSLAVIAVASSVNYLSVAGSSLAGGSVSIGAAGTDTDLSINISPKGAGNIGLYGSSVPQVVVVPTASANRYITLTGSNGGNPTIGTSAGAINLSPGGAIGLSVSAIDSAVNYLSVLPSVLGDAFVSLSTQGAATNITMNLLGKGSGAVHIGSPVTFAAQTVGTTVGAAGGASALPATPLGYLTTTINGTACKVPYYTA